MAHQKIPRDEAPDLISRLPALAAKAEDLDAMQKAVEDSAAVSGGLWLSYLFVLLYLAIAAGAVTHADLLLQNPVKLPFLNIELPLYAFFLLAPLLFIISHAYTLINLALLADRVKHFHLALDDQIPKSLKDSKTAEVRAGLARQLPSNIFVQFLGGPEEIRGGLFGRLLGGILWVTLVVAPIALLLLIQLQFLPYHDLSVTWTSRIALVLDISLVWWLWRRILVSRVNRRSRAPRLWKAVAKQIMAALFIALLILFAVAVATVPGEWQEDHLPGKLALEWLRSAVFFGDADPTTGRRKSLFSNTLVLPSFNIYEALKVEDPKKIRWKESLIDLRGRDLRGALLYRAVLRNSDLSGAQLQQAFLAEAQLQGARLDGAQLQRAELMLAQAQGASFFQAQLQGTLLNQAQLQGASLREAQLQGAVLTLAELQGATLEKAQLQGASMDWAQLQGASLKEAQLQGAQLNTAQLQGASFDQAQLQGASLNDAGLWRAQLQGVAAKDLLLTRNPHWNPAILDMSELVARNSARWRIWSDKTYTGLRESIERVLLEGSSARKASLDRIAVLDCALKGDTFASCDPSTDLPNTIKQWKESIEAARIDERAYAKVLAGILGDLVCSDDPNRIYVLGTLLRGEVRKPGTEMPALVQRITSAECPISSMLTDDDKQLLTDVWMKAMQH